MSILSMLAIGSACLAGLYGLHRLADGAESRGWIHYRKTRASGNALGAAALALQDAFESGKCRHVLEARETRSAKDRDAGPEPPTPPRRSQP